MSQETEIWSKTSELQISQKSLQITVIINNDPDIWCFFSHSWLMLTTMILSMYYCEHKEGNNDQPHNISCSTCWTEKLLCGISGNLTMYMTALCWIQLWCCLTFILWLNKCFPKKRHEHKMHEFVATVVKTVITHVSQENVHS